MRCLDGKNESAPKLCDRSPFATKLFGDFLEEDAKTMEESKTKLTEDLLCLSFKTGGGTDRRAITRNPQPAFPKTTKQQRTTSTNGKKQQNLRMIARYLILLETLQ